MVEVTFVWVPSHVGIEGNECADKLAGSGAVEGLNTNVYPSYKELCSDYKCMTRDKFEKMVQATGKKHLQKLIRSKFVSYSTHKNLDCAYTRLRLNATKIILRQRMGDPMVCGSCGITLTHNHMFFDTEQQCPQYTNERVNLEKTLLDLGQSVIDLDMLIYPPKRLFDKVVAAVIAFLKITNFYNYL